jgi:phosphate uptake regulator
MADDAESAQTERETVDEEQEDLNADDAVDELCEELLRENRVLFYELREVV